MAVPMAVLSGPTFLWLPAWTAWLAAASVAALGLRQAVAAAVAAAAELASTAADSTGQQV